MRFANVTIARTPRLPENAKQILVLPSFDNYQTTWSIIGSTWSIIIKFRSSLLQYSQTTIYKTHLKQSARKLFVLLLSLL